MDDADDGLMLNLAASSPGGSSKKPKQTAKSRYAQKRNNRSQGAFQPTAPSLTASTQLHHATASTPELRTSTSAQAPVVASASPAKRPRTHLTHHSVSASSGSTRSTNLISAARVSPTQPKGSSKPREKHTPLLSSSSALSSATNSRPNGTAAAPSGGVISALFPSHGVLEEETTTSLPFTSRPYNPTNAPSSTSDFPSLGLDPLLTYHLSSKMKIGSNPTPIQKVALPHLLHPDLDRDILIQAQTGSGKTLTYLLPIIQSLLPLCQESFIDRSIGTLAIILAPTRELARQIYEVLEKLVSLSLSLKEQNEHGADESAIRRTRWLVPGLLSGGSTKNHEKQRLRKGCPILVSTPGRLLDHLQNTSSFDVGKCRWLVLDEADRLLEMGFEEQLNGIVRAIDGRRRLALAAARQAMPGFNNNTIDGDPDSIKDQDVVDSLGMHWWSKERRVVLCSATLDENVQMLAGKTLQSPKILRTGKDEGNANSVDQGQEVENAFVEKAPVTRQPAKFAAPAQLQQNLVSTPPKLRLVTLIALLRAYITRARKQMDGSIAAGSGRVIVFMSCTDSVDFHYAAFGGARMNAEENNPDEENRATESQSVPASTTSELLPEVSIFRLHGSMTQQERIASLRGFSGTKAQHQEGGFQGSILLCTSVASRGLDLPDVGCVIQLDPPTEGGIEEYLHRVGRTARVGRAGESWLMVLPRELGWVDTILERQMTIESSDATTLEAAIDLKNQGASRKINAASIEKVLQHGFGGVPGTLEYQSRATGVQLAFERWVISGERPSLLARKAFLSHVRAYATHSADEKIWFNVRALHLGHLAKAFALREAPKSLGAKSAGIAAASKLATTSAEEVPKNNKRSRQEEEEDADTNSDDDDSELNDVDGGSDYEMRVGKNGDKKGTSHGHDAFELNKEALARLTQSIASGGANGSRLAKEALRAAMAASGKKAGAQGKKGDKQTDAEARMYAKVRAMGRMSKKDGVLGTYGIDEFQIG